jgi:hypothetical protein
MPLFYTSLYKKTPPEKCSSFAPEKKRTKDLQTKIPDPNESWGHFFKRLINMELYNPPLVDRKSVQRMNSLYMNSQMKLLENEYGIKMSYYNKNEEEEEKDAINDTNNFENNTNINIGVKNEKDEPILKIKKKVSKETLDLNDIDIDTTNRKFKQSRNESSENSDIVKIFVKNNNKDNIEQDIEKKNKSFFNRNNNQFNEINKRSKTIDGNQ